MDAVNFTNATLAKIVPGSPRIRDTRLPVVAVPAKNKNRISFFLVKRWPNKKSATWIKLGVYPEIDWLTARKKCLQILADGVLHGNSHSAVANANYNSFNKVNDILDWYQQLVLIDKNLSKSRRKNVLSIISTHLRPRLCDLNLSDVSIMAIRDLLFIPLYAHYKISYVELVLRTMKQVFALAVKSELIDVNPLLNMTLKSFTTASVKPKKAAFAPNEIKSVIKSIATERRSWLRVMCAIQLMYAIRRVEVCKMAWEPQIDITNKLYRMPGEIAKNGKGHSLPLTDIALRIMQYHKAEKRKKGQRGNWLFQAITCPWRHINESYAGSLISSMLGSGTGHDLRKVARRSWSEMQIDTHVSELLLNHKTGILLDTYVQDLLLDNCREALEKWHCRLEEYGLVSAVCGKN